MSNDEQFSYEDKYDIIEEELNKRRGKWFLTSLAWIGFDDVKQMIHAHLHKKWDQWDQKRPLKPWLNRIISNQLKNILRNYYGNFAKPCLSCPFNQSGVAEENTVGSCGFTKSGEQCNECPLYAKWEKTKKSAYNVKMAVPLDSHLHETNMSKSFGMEIDAAERRLHEEMRKVLSERHFDIYEMLFIKNIPDEEVAKALGYRTTEKGRKAGYKQIKNLKSQFKQKAEHILKTKDIFYGSGRIN